MRHKGPVCSGVSIDGRGKFSEVGEDLGKGRAKKEDLGKLLKLTLVPPKTGVTPSSTWFLYTRFEFWKFFRS